MNSSVCFEQKGFIESAGNDRISVRIDRGSACGPCSAKVLCGLTGLSERIIEVDGPSGEYHTGEEVTVVITRSMGNRALVLGYLVPFLLLISVLTALTALSVAEWIAGLASVLALVPYFIILYFFREKLRRTIVFSIHKSG